MLDLNKKLELIKGTMYMLKKNIFKIIALLIFSSPAFAYLDPGTGSMLLYFIMGVVATFIYFIKGIFYKINKC